MQVKLFPYFTSIPLDYLLTSWVTSCAHNRGFLTWTLHWEKFKAYSLAKVHNFLSEIMKKIFWVAYTMLWQFCVFVTNRKIHQTLNFYLKSTKTIKCPNPVNYFSEFASITQSATARLPFKHSCCHTITNYLLFASQLVSGKFSQLKVKIYRLLIVSSMNISISCTKLLHP